MRWIWPSPMTTGLSPRRDLWLSPAGESAFTEVNTIPGFTSHSRYPNMMKGIGLSFEELLERLLRLYEE